MMKPAVWTDAFVELQPEEAVKRLAKIGWKFIELADKHCRDLDKLNHPEKKFEALRDLCENLHVSIVQMHGPMFNVCVEQERLLEMDLAKRAMRWARILGVKWMIFHPGRLPDMVKEDEALEKVRQTNREVIMELLEAEPSSEVGIALENIFGKEAQRRAVYGSTPSELLWLVHNTDTRRVGVCWDTGHANLQGLDQSQAIKALNVHLVATHIADNDTSRDQHLLPFEGNIDWRSIITALKEIRYDGLFNLEIGGAVHRIPLSLRDSCLHYALKLAESLCEGNLW